MNGGQFRKNKITLNHQFIRSNYPNRYEHGNKHVETQFLPHQMGNSLLPEYYLGSILCFTRTPFVHPLYTSCTSNDIQMKQD